MGDVKWLATYMGVSYLMIGGIVLHVSVMWFFRTLQHEGKIGSVIADLAIVLNLFLFFILHAHVMGAVFSFGKYKGVHDDYFLNVFAVSGFIFLMCAFFMIKKLSSYFNRAAGPISKA